MCYFFSKTSCLCSIPSILFGPLAHDIFPQSRNQILPSFVMFHCFPFMYLQYYFITINMSKSRFKLLERRVFLSSESISCSVMSDSMTPWTVACQAPLSMEFCRQEYQSGQPFPSPGDLPNPGIEPWFPALQTDSLLSEPPGKPFLSKYLFTPSSVLSTKELLSKCS